jgi:hypothetical protein
MQWLLLAVFIPCVFSFPFEFPSDLETSYVTGANQTLVERNHLYKRAADYSSIVTWGYECNEDRIKYLSEELDETKTLVSIARKSSIFPMGYSLYRRRRSGSHLRS